MESEGRSGPPPAACRLHVPDLDEDEGEVEISIRPKCSPLPRRRTSFSDDEGEESGRVFTPGGSRRVSFADAKGLSLVHVKEFDSCDVPTAPQSEGDGMSAEEYSLAPLTFQSPLSPEDLLVRVQEQKIELESLELIPGTTTLKGLICVLNMSFHKAVYVRTTLDSWASHFDLLTEYIPNCDGDAHTDRFSFKLTLVPPFPEQGSRVDFCLRYETPVGTFWANNDCRNYVLVCRPRAKERGVRHEKQNAQKKSCLKSVSQIFSEDTLEISPEKLSEDKPTKEDGVNQDFQSNQSKEDSKNLQVEIKHNCSRRNQRKAARMARVKDYFSQRDGVVAASDTSRLEEIPAGDRTAAKCFSEQKPKLEDPAGIPEKTFGETSTRRNETRIPNESQTPEEITLSSLPQGDASTRKSNDNEYFKTLVSEPEKKTENCRSPSNGVPFEPATPPLRHQLLGGTEDDWTWPENTQEVNSIGRGVVENVTWNKQDVRILQNLVTNDIKKQDSLDGVHGSVTEDPGLRSMDKMQNHQDIWETVTKNSTLNGTGIRLNPSQMDTSASGSSRSVQNHSEIGEDHQVSSATGGGSDGEEDVVKGHQKHEKQLNNGTGESRNSDFEICLPGNNIWRRDHQENRNTDRNADMDLPSRGSLGLDFESESIQVPTCPPIRRSEGGFENNNALLASLVSEDIKNQTGLEFDGWSHSGNSVGGATNSEDFNRPKGCSYSATDGTGVGKPSTFLETQETYLKDNAIHHFCEDLDNHSQAVSFFVAVSDSWHEDLQEPDRSPEIDQIQNGEAMLEEENVSEEEEPKDVQNCPGIERLDNPKEDIAAMKTPTVEEAGLNETTWGAEAHLAEMLEGKKKVEVREEGADHDAAYVRKDQRDVEKRNKENLDGVEDKDDSQMWRLDQKELEEELWTHLCEDPGSGEDPKAQILDESPLREDDRLSEEPESDEASVETDSDDEVELYMHCLRAVQTKDRGAEVAFGLSERPSLRRSKALSSPMPSISEALDEERGGLWESHENPPTASPKPSRPEMADGNAARSRETCTRDCVSKTLLYATLMAVFVVTAYYYDFLACFGLYLISVLWLLCQSEKQTIKDNSIG
ncbi:uncharacterized protein LOC144070973 isoform X2 [Stigmatopora argus]